MVRKLLLIEDDPNITDFMEVVLEKERYQLVIAGNVNAAAGGEL